MKAKCIRCSGMRGSSSNNAMQEQQCTGRKHNKRPVHQKRQRSENWTLSSARSIGSWHSNAISVIKINIVTEPLQSVVDERPVCSCNIVIIIIQHIIISQTPCISLQCVAEIKTLTVGQLLSQHRSVSTLYYRNII